MVVLGQRACSVTSLRLTTKETWIHLENLIASPNSSTLLTMSWHGGFLSAPNWRTQAEGCRSWGRRFRAPSLDRWLTPPIGCPQPPWRRGGLPSLGSATWHPAQVVTIINDIHDYGVRFLSFNISLPFSLSLYGRKFKCSSLFFIALNRHTLCNVSIISYFLAFVTIPPSWGNITTLSSRVISDCCEYWQERY